MDRKSDYSFLNMTQVAFLSLKIGGFTEMSWWLVFVPLCIKALLVVEESLENA